MNRFFPARSGRHGEACVVLEFPYRAENQGHFGTLTACHVMYCPTLEERNSMTPPVWFDENCHRAGRQS